MVVGQPDFSRVVKVRPDGRLSGPGVGDFLAAGRTVPEVTEAIRSDLRRLIRYPEVSVMLSASAPEVIYVFGEVRVPGAHPYMPNMTALHAIGAAGGQKDTGKLNSVVVLRRTGPNELDVFPLDLERSIDAGAGARDVGLRPYDVVYVPRTFIGSLNLFVDKFIRQNIAPFTAYIEGWRALHVDDLYWRVNQ
jgi:protein involved in polysaccharide export with SLBB domain